MAAGDHVINNKKVDPKKAKARHGKIFVGGLTTELTDEDIKHFFSQFGTVSIIVSLVCYYKMYISNQKKVTKLNVCYRLLKWKCHLIRQRIRGEGSASLRLIPNKQ